MLRNPRVFSPLLGEATIAGRWPVEEGLSRELRVRGYAMAKRAMDVTAAAVGLLLLLPVLAVIAVAVKLSSPGPVFFRQVRVGLYGLPFEILKFRTMRPGNAGPLVTSRGDARITAVGRVLRNKKLDELPQLWNVLVGDMSLVGPRPQTPGYVRLYPREYAIVHTVRPGITDFATLHHRHEESLLGEAADPEAKYIREILPEKLALQHRYIRERSLATDRRLVFRTLTAIFH